MTMLQLATVLTGSLLTTERVELDETEEVDRIIEESIRIVKKIKKGIEKS